MKLDASWGDVWAKCWRSVLIPSDRGREKRERNWERNCWVKRDQNLEDFWKILIPPILKREKACPEENTKGVVALPLSRGKPMITGAGTAPAERKGTGDVGQMKEGCWAWFAGQDQGPTWLWACAVPKGKGKNDTKQDSGVLRTALPLLGARLFLPQLPRVGPPLRFCGSGRSHTVP